MSTDAENLSPAEFLARSFRRVSEGCCYICQAPLIRGERYGMCPSRGTCDAFTLQRTDSRYLEASTMCCQGEVMLPQGSKGTGIEIYVHYVGAASPAPLDPDVWRLPWPAMVTVRQWLEKEM